jgi:hypothetical protein
MSNSRREVLVTIAAASAQAHVHDQAEQTGALPASSYQPKVFSASELATLGALVETIIPRTKTPGALDAKVHELIDETLASRPTQAPAWRKGLKDVEALSRRRFRKPYAQLFPGDQAAVMVELSNRNPFFKLLKDATCDAYYSTREGLMTELGWDAGKPQPAHIGCTHPEHQL